jgi:hypothetical protein
MRVAEQGDDRSLIRTMRVDQVTGEVVKAMRAAGVRPLLLKGPAVARWPQKVPYPLPAPPLRSHGRDRDLIRQIVAACSSPRAERAAEPIRPAVDKVD